MLPFFKSKGVRIFFFLMRKQGCSIENNSPITEPAPVGFSTRGNLLLATLRTRSPGSISAFRTPRSAGLPRGTCSGAPERPLRAPSPQPAPAAGARRPRAAAGAGGRGGAPGPPRGWHRTPAPQPFKTPQRQGSEGRGRFEGKSRGYPASVKVPAD